MIISKSFVVRTWLLRSAGGFLAFIFVFWSACHLWVPGAIKNAVESYSKKIGYEISYQALRVSPLRLRVEIDGLRLIDGREERLLGIKTSVVMLKWSSLMVGEIGFDEISLDQPSILLEKHSVKGNLAQWNWQEFITANTRQLPAADSARSKGNIKISVDEFKISNAALELLDSSQRLHEQFKPLSVELFDIANYDKKGNVNGVRGQYGLNLGALHFTLPGLNKKISF